MFRKSLLAAALAVPAIALASAAYAGEAYQGGPKSGTAAARTAAKQQFDPNNAYAQAIEERKGKHVYQGGPSSNIPMASH